MSEISQLVKMCQSYNENETDSAFDNILNFINTRFTFVRPLLGFNGKKIQRINYCGIEYNI